MLDLAHPYQAQQFFANGKASTGKAGNGGKETGGQIPRKGRGLIRRGRFSGA